MLRVRYFDIIKLNSKGNAQKYSFLIHKKSYLQNLKVAFL
ncbi:hypothetical protein THALO_180245 [Tenacibaculum halocynthiae]